MQNVHVHNCYAHELNLVICHTCRAVSEAKEFFDMLDNFFNSSPVNHHIFEETQKIQCCSNLLSNTHCACQLRSVSAVLANFPAIIECLSTINTPLAVGVKAKLCKFSSIYLLFVFQSLLSVTAGLHRYLQKETIDLSQAVAYKNAVTDSLKEKRSNATAADLHAQALCEANDISVPEHPLFFCCRVFSLGRQ